MNEFLILLQAKLDELKSKENINADIINIQDKINTLNLIAKLDSKSIIAIKNQLEEIANQTIKLSNINADSKKIISSGEKIGQQLGNNINKSLQSALYDVKQNMANILNDLNSKKLSTVDLSKLFNLDRASLDNSVKEKVRGLTKELNLLAKEVVTTNSEGAWEKLVTNVSALNKVLSASGMSRDISSFKESLDILDYFQNKKIFIGNKSDVLSNTGLSVKELNNQFRNLGVTFTTVSKGSTKLDSIWSELFNFSPNLRDISSYGDQLNTIVNHLKIAKNAKFGESNLTPVNSQDVSKVLVEWLNNVDKLSRKMQSFQEDQAEIEQKIAQESDISSDKIVNNERKKQKEYEKTAKAKQKYSENSTIVKSSENIISFDNVSNAADKAKQHFKELLASEKAVVSTIEHIDENNNLDSFVVKIKRATGVIEQLNYKLSENKFDFVSGTINNNGIEKQINAMTVKADSLKTKLNELKSKYSDLNAPGAIKNEKHLSELSKQYNIVSKAIDNVRNSDSSTFLSMVSNAQKEISVLKIMAKEFKNAETAASSLRTKDVATVRNKYASELDVLITKMKSFGLYTNGFQKGADNLKNILNNITSESDSYELTVFLNGMDKLSAGFKRAQASVKAFNQEKKVEIKTSGLESRLAEIQRISPEIINFKTQLGNVDVTIKSLLNDLSKVSTNDDFSVVKERIAAFENAAKAAGYAVSETTLKTESLEKQINKIQLLSFGGIKNDYSTQITSLSGNFRSLGLEQDVVNQKLINVTNAYDNLKTRINQPFDETNYNEIIALNDILQKELAESNNEYKRLQASTKGYVSEQKRLNQANIIEAWNQKNSRVTTEVISKNNDYIASLRDLNSQMTNMQFNRIVNGFKQSENAMRGLGKLGVSLKTQMSQALSSLTTYFSASAAMMKFVSSTRTAVTELKEVDTYITEISKANKDLTKSELEQIGNNSFGTASKYGKTATDYLSGVQEASRAGYINAEEIAELSTAAQGAGDMTAELANKMIIATDKAYKLGGSAKELRNVLDGVNYISNNNAVNMTNLSEGMSIAGSTAASFGIGVNELTSALGTMVASTQQSGSEVARAFKAILLNIRQVSDAEEGIDAEGLTKYEQACNALGVSLKETKNGIQQLRDPMQVLKELSIEYNKLSETDIKRTNLLNSVGGKLRSTQLDALLRQWSMYENMLRQYDEGVGSMAVEAEKTANSWEGSLNRLHNTWVSTIGNVAESDTIITIINGFNNLLSVIQILTDKLGSLGTIGLGAGLFAGLKNVGRDKMYSLICYLF